MSPTNNPSPATILVLSRDQERRISDGAVAALPNEDCGLLTGVEHNGQRRVTRLWPARNLARDPSRGFDLDPSVRIKAEVHCRASGERVLGHWHSHPNGRRDPSAQDLAMAYEPDLIWLIVAVGAGAADAEGGTHLGAFQPNADLAAFEPVALHVVEDDET